jgi:hypothetical protein
VSDPVWVITVVKDDVRGLARTTASVQGQEAVRLRHLVVDGGSKDGSHEMGMALARQGLADFLPGPDRGVFDGMNRGLRAVPDGALVWFLNAGDFLLGPRVVASALSRLDEEGSKQWIGGMMVLICPSGRVLKAVGGSDTSTGWLGFRRRPSGTPPQPSVLVPKVLIDDLGGFRGDLRVGADGVLLSALSREHPPVLDADAYVGFPLGGLSTSSAMDGFTDFWSNLPGQTTTRPGRLRRASMRLRVYLRQRMCLEQGLTSRVFAGLLRWMSRRGRMQQGVTCQWPNHKRRRGSLECCLGMGA